MNEVVKLLRGDQLNRNVSVEEERVVFLTAIGHTPCSTEFMKQVLP